MMHLPVFNDRKVWEAAFGICKDGGNQIYKKYLTG